MIKLVNLTAIGQYVYTSTRHRVEVVRGSFRLVSTSVYAGWCGIDLELGVFDFQYTNGWLAIAERTTDETRIQATFRIRRNGCEDVFDTIKRGCKMFMRELYGED